MDSSEAAENTLQTSSDDVASVTSKEGILEKTEDMQLDLSGIWF